MLRPGEVGKIKAKHVRQTGEGTWVRLVGRKSDKVIRADPWHLVECSKGGFCPACGLMDMSDEAGKGVRGGETEVFRDWLGQRIKSEQVGGIMNSILRRLNILKPGECDWLTGKTLRVGGAMAAAMGGVSELIIRITGSWKSEALLKYTGGVMAARTNLSGIMRGVNASRLPFMVRG
jgi:hypothetical protein